MVCPFFPSKCLKNPWGNPFCSIFFTIVSILLLIVFPWSWVITPKLTSEQKQIIADYNKKIADLEKEFINKLLSEGLITQQQADNIIKNIDSRVSEANQDNVPFFIGGGRGFDKGFFGIGRIDTSKLTEQQKAALTEIYKQMASLQKDIVNKLVSEGLLTQDQANKITSAIDNAIANADKKGYATVSHTHLTLPTIYSV